MIAERAMIGTRGRPKAASCALMDRVASKPSMPGIMQSISTRSGRSISRSARPDGFYPVRDMFDLVSLVRQHRTGDKRIHIVVFHQQDASADVDAVRRRRIQTLVVGRRRHRVGT